MRVIALIEDPAVVRAVLTHLGLPQPEAPERAPPERARAWLTRSNLLLTYTPGVSRVPALDANPPDECAYRLSLFEGEAGMYLAEDVKNAALATAGE